MRPLAALLAMLTFAACDSNSEPEVLLVPPREMPPTSTGTFTATLNGEPFEVPATLQLSHDSAFVRLRASRIDSSQVPANEQILRFSYDTPRFVEGADLPTWERVEGSSHVRGVFLDEGAADQVYNVWDPLDKTSVGLRVVELDSVAGRFRATTDLVLVAAREMATEYQRLPDTLRFAGGEFVIDLAGEGE